MTGWYRWRDPARLTTARRAELARHDAASPPDPPPSPLPGQPPAGYAPYAAFRDDGLTVTQAATACGISKTTRNRYERIRKEAMVSEPR